MKSSLKTLQRIQKFNIDEQRKILVDLQNKEEALQNELTLMIQKFEEEKKFMAENPGFGDFGAYVKRFIENREVLERAIAAIGRKIEQVRDLIADLFKEQKTYEIVDDNRKKHRLKEENDKEQKMLDEVGTNTYIKRQEAKKSS